MGKAAVATKPGAGGATGMDKAELKRVLRMAQQEPVHVAFALAGDGKAIVVADKRKPPRALEKELKEGAPDSKNHRFGTASVDPHDSKLVRFTVNKASNGMGRKLAVALKGTGYNKVEIGSEDGAPPERHEEAEEGEGGTSAGAQGAAPGMPAEAAKPGAASAPGGEAAVPGGARGSNLPKFQDDPSPTHAMLSKLDQWQRDKVKFILQNGKPEKLDDVVKREADHLWTGEQAVRQIAKGVAKDVDAMSGIWARLSGKQHFVDDARKYLAAVDQSLGAITKALGSTPRDLAHAYSCLQDAFRSLHQVLGEVAHYYDKAADQWGGAVRVATGVRDACSTTLTALATPLGPAAVGAASAFGKALEEIDNVATGQQVHLGKDAAEIILDVTIVKFAKPIGQAIERPLGTWVAKNLGPKLATAADSALVKSFEEWAGKNIPRQLAPHSAEWMKAFYAFVQKESLEKKIVDTMKDMVLENAKKILVFVADRASHKHESKPIKERCIEFLREVQNGEWIQEKGSEKLMDTLLHQAAERAVGH